MSGGPGGAPPPEVRLDQLTGLRTILAPARAERPIEFVDQRRKAEEAPPGAPGRASRASERPSDDSARASHGEVSGVREEAPPDSCPFCPGKEDRTPLETWADRPEGGDPNTPGWRVRAVPNLYPALVPPEGGVDDESAPAMAKETGFAAGADPLRASARGAEPDLFASAPAAGRHEIIIHSPEHRTSIGDLTDDEIAAAVGGWRQRMRDLSADAAYVQLIVNDGPDAGASLEHSHAQLYAMRFVPALVARERERFAAYNQRTMGGDLLSDILAEEVRRRERLVAIDDEAALICPWASRSPFELRLVPRRAAPRFEEDGEVGVGMLRRALGALAARFDRLPQLNLWVRTAPRGAEPFHWHIDIAPRIGIRAGFEMSTGVDLNIYPPERAASELREALE